MCQVKSFACGLLKLRTGCIVIPVLSLIISAITYGYNINHWHWTYGFGLVIEAIVWVILLFGAILNNAKMVIATLFGLIIVIIIRTLSFVYVLILLNREKLVDWKTGKDWREAKTTFLIVAIMEFIVVIPIYLYWGIVMNSFYRTLKRNQSGVF